MTILSRLAAVILLFGLPGMAVAQTPLKWGADANSGAPYEFADPANGKRIIGFEVDIANALARRMNRPAQFVQNDWDNLIPGLERGEYDIAMGGLEITPDRAQVISFSTPYYVTFEQFVTRRDDTTVDSLDAARGKTVGTLKASLAQRILDKAGGIAVRGYAEEVNAYSDLQNGRLDAVLLDFPIALYYAALNPALKLVGSPVGRVQYGIAVRKDDAAMLQAVNDGFAAMVKDGELRAILENWKLWTPTMATVTGDFTPSTTEPQAYRAFVAATAPADGPWTLLKRYAGFLPLLGKAAIVTLEISILAMVLAMAIGLLLALARMYGSAPLSLLATGYIEVVRGTPLLIQILFIFYGLPNIGIKLDPFVAGILALGLNYAAYEAENYRAGLQSVPHGQTEAAIALNMTHRQALRHVVVPQALRFVMPSMTNDFISLLKDSSLVSVITMIELTQTYIRLSTTYYDYFGTGILVAVCYLLLGLPFVRLARWAEQRLAVDKRGAAAGTAGRERTRTWLRRRR